MIIYVNDKNEIKDVDITEDESLIALEINDEENPFSDWTVAKICCYKAEVNDGVVTMMTPYIDSRIIEHIDQLGSMHDVNVEDISTNRDGLTEAYEEVLTNTDDMAIVREAIEELYELIMEE